jgi:glycosyltransferase involved in cell wall biosynthesis
MKVLIIHFRSAPTKDWKPASPIGDGKESDSAGTDGVSLEMKKRRSLLEEMGHQVAICSAYGWAEYPLPALEFDSDEARKMMRNLFDTMTDFPGEDALKSAFKQSADALKEGLGKAIREFSPDALFVHNILCLPIHPAATVALTELLRETGIPCTAVHHDILSEGAYKFNPTCEFASSLLQTYFPPTMSNLSHWTINSRNKKALGEKGVTAEIIHDTMDFDDQLDAGTRAGLRKELRAKYGIQPHEVVLFVGARIVPNKQTEVAGQLTAILQDSHRDFVDQKLYNGMKFTRKARIVLLLAGRPEAAFLDYKQKLFDLFNRLKINWVYAGDDVRPVRSEEEGHYALHPDMYTMADFVLYPTGWEGFGNQLLESFAAGLPAAVFEYPVFKEDIAPKEARVVSLGDLCRESPEGLIEVPILVLQRAALEIIELLTSRELYQEMTEDNLEVGKQYFGFDVLRKHLQDSLDWAKSVAG